MAFKKYLLSIILFLLLIIGFATCKSIEGRPYAIILDPIGLSQEEIRKIDSISLIPTDRFEGNIVKRMFLGENYREAWATPVTVPIGNLKELKGGLKPLKLGGGAQTLSMDLEGPEGVIYTLRSINKNPDVIIPKFAYNFKIQNVVMDGISTQHPFGAILSAALAKEAGVLSTEPQVFFVPHQAALDTFDQKMGGRLFLLEYEPEGSGKWVKMEGVQKIIDTDDVRKILEKKPNATIDQRALIRSRLFDLLIGDWDRHEGQWGWIVVEQNNQTTFVPLPTDRDNAFYNPRGVIPWVMTRPMFKPRFRPFRKNISHMKGLVGLFDAEFLHDISESIYMQEVVHLQTALSDDAIDRAMKSWAPEFVKIDGAKIKKIIKARRKDLPKHAKRFKKIVDKKWKKEMVNKEEKGNVGGDKIGVEN